MASTVNEQAHNAWWLFTIQGIVTILFGLLALFWPGLTLLTLVYLFALYIVIAGLVNLVSGFAKIHTSKHWWLTLLGGLAGLVIGIYLIRNPGLAIGTFILLAGLSLVIQGVFDIVSASVFSETGEKVLSVIAGVVSLLAGIAIWVYPVGGGIAFVWVVGLFAVIRGSIEVALAISARKDVDRLGEFA